MRKKILGIALAIGGISGFLMLLGAVGQAELHPDSPWLLRAITGIILFLLVALLIPRYRRMSDHSLSWDKEWKELRKIFSPK